MHRIRKYLSPPVLDDPVTEYAAKILRAFLLTICTGSVLILPLVLIFSPGLLIRIGIPAVFLLFFCILLLFVSHKGHIRQASIALVSVLWLLFITLAFTGTGVRAPIFVGGMLVSIFIAGLLVSNKFGLLVTLMSILVGLILAVAENTGRYVPNADTLNPFAAWIIGGIFLLAVAFMQTATTNILRGALLQATKELAERKEAQESEEATLNLLKLVINSSPDMIFVKDAQLRILMCNQKTGALVGKSPEEMIGHTDIENGWPQHVVDGDPEAGIRGFEQTDREALSGKTVNIPAESVSINGEKRILETLKLPLTDQNGHIFGVLGIAHDITELIKAQENAEKLLRGLRGVIESADELIQLESLDTIYRRTVELAREKLGVERCWLYLFDTHELLRQNGTFGTDRYGNTTDERKKHINYELPVRILESKDKPWNVLNRSFLSLFEGQAEEETGAWVAITILRTARGRLGIMYNDASISGSEMNPAQQESLAVFCSLVANIIERRRVEDREQAFMSGLRGIIEATNELIQIDNSMLFYRRAVELVREKLGVERCSLHLYNAQKDHLIGTFGTDLSGNTIAESRKIDTISIDEAALNDRPWTLRYLEQKEENGTPAASPTWQCITPIMSTGGPIGALCNDTAISRAEVNETLQEALAVYCSLLGRIIERKRFEEELREHRETLEEQVAHRTIALENSNKELESFTYTVSHGLRHPLRSIDGYSRLLAHEHSDNLSPNALSYLQNIRQSAQQMGHLIDDFLAFTRIGRQSFTRRPLTSNEIHDLVESIIEGFLHSPDGKTADVKIGRLHPCEADMQSLKQIFTHLISNAFKYSRESSERHIEIGSAASEHGLAYFVRDTGIGIDMRYADKLFDPLFRLHKPGEFEGTGVGLAIVRRLVERHGGKVWVQSEPDKGSTFFFTLESPKD